MAPTKRTPSRSGPRSLEAIGARQPPMTPPPKVPRQPRELSGPDSPEAQAALGGLDARDILDARGLLLWGRANGFILGEVQVGAVRLQVLGDVKLMPGATKLVPPEPADQAGIYETYGGDIYKRLAKAEDDPNSTFEDDDEEPEPAPPRRPGKRR
jgi:hypothetical protein